MAKRTKKPPAPPARVAAPKGSSGGAFARYLASAVREAHGAGSADTLDVSEAVGDPVGYVPWGNIAIQRAVGSNCPLGRFIEFSGWESSGKSTALDQLFASCQRIDGGIGVLADTERGRVRTYMTQLGVLPETLVWVGGKTIEEMFEEVETVVKQSTSLRNRAWADALTRAGVKVGKLPTVMFNIFDPHDHQSKRKPIASWPIVQWTNAARAALIEYQAREGLPTTGIRDAVTAASLKPVVILGVDDDRNEMKAALENWTAGIPDDRCQPADAPIIIGWDSVAATPAQKELDAAAGDSHPAIAAKLIRFNLRRLSAEINDQGISIVMVNQKYNKLNMGPMAARGPKTETYGGGGPKYYSSVRLSYRKIGLLYARSTDRAAGLSPIGQMVEVHCFKNKLGSPERKESFAIIYGRGAVDAWAFYSDLKDRGIIKVGGAWSSFTDPTLAPSAGSWQRGWAGLETIMNATPGLEAKLRQIYLEGAR